MQSVRRTSPLFWIVLEQIKLCLRVKEGVAYFNSQIVFAMKPDYTIIIFLLCGGCDKQN